MNRSLLFPKFFVRLDTKQALCKICTKTFNKTTGNSSLRFHLLGSHQEQAKEFDKIEKAATSQKRKATETPKIGDFFKRKRSDKEELFELAATFALNSLPHSLIDEPHFRKILKTPVSSGLLREAIIDLAEKLSHDVLKQLRGRPTTICIDGWTNVVGEKTTNVLLVADGAAYYWSSIVIHEENTADNICRELRPIIQKLLDEGVRVIAVTGDNENLMKATQTKLVGSFPFLIKIGCCAHVVQLMLKKRAESEPLKSAFEKIQDILHRFSSNKALRSQVYSLLCSCLISTDNVLQLLKTQRSNKKQPKKLVRIAETRWTSYLLAIDRIILLKPELSYILSLSPSYWEDIEKSRKIVAPFHAFSKAIEKDDATLLDASNAFKALKTKTSSKEEEKEVIQLYIDRHCNSEVMQAAELLSFMTRDSENCFDFIVDWGCTYLAKFDIAVDNTYNLLTEQLGKFVARNPPFHRIPDLKSKSGKPSHVWGRLIGQAPELCEVALALLTIACTESCVERSFSAQKRVHTETRSAFLSPN